MESSELVVVQVAKTSFEAQVLAGILRGANIPVYVADQMLQDEFAVSQRITGATSVRLQVRPEDLERAREALAEADRSADLLDSEDFDPGERIE